MASFSLASVSLQFEYDLVAAHRRARQIAELLGFADGEQTRIATVVSELARNALRHAGGGSVEFCLESGEGDFLSISIVDRGGGIPNVDDVLSRAGTGLAEARRSIDDFQIHTSPAGTIVTVRERVPPQAMPLTAESLPNPALLRVLVIDDDETTRYTIANFAAAPEVEILEADNGFSGIARARADRPDVIMLDLVMPGVGGHEVLGLLKADPATASIPVVIVTSRFVNEGERSQILTRAAGVLYKGDLARDTVTRAIADALTK